MRGQDRLDGFYSAHVLGEREAVAAVAEYERRNRWVGFLIRPALSWLAGWRYDGGEDARRRLAQQLPVVAFRPEPARTGPRS